MSPGYWGFAMLVALVAALLAFELLPLPRGVAAIEIIDFGQGEGPMRQVTLPDNWRLGDDRSDGVGTYRFALPPPGAEPTAIFIPAFSGALSVTVAGFDLSPGGILSGRLVPDQSVPFLAVVPRSIAAEGAMVELTLAPGGKLVGFLGPVYVGPESLLRGSYAWFHFRAVQLPTLVLVWQLLLAGLLLVLWHSRRREKAALCGALILLFSSVHSLPVYLPQAYGLAAFATDLGLVLNFWQSVVGLIFAYALSDRKMPVPVGWLLLPPAISTLAYYMLPAHLFARFDLAFVMPFSVVLAIWIAVVLFRGAVFEGRRDMLLILLGIVAAICLMVHDVLVLSAALPDSNFLHFRVVFILILPAMSVIFFDRLVASMNRVDDLVQTLEDRISVAEAKLTLAHNEQTALEREKALNAERQRIMRDVHDGLGGQLVSIIAMSRMGETDSRKIEDSAEAALGDLRMVIGSLNVEDDISGMLGTFRESAAHQLSVQGIELDWRMIDIPAIEGMNPSRALNILRIMQEATTNVIKHSGADRFTIAFDLEDDAARCLRIDMWDNGRGHGADNGTGHGLANMRRRAAELGGTLEIAPGSPGLRVSLRVPTKRV